MKKKKNMKKQMRKLMNLKKKKAMQIIRITQFNNSKWIIKVTKINLSQLCKHNRHSLMYNSHKLQRRMSHSNNSNNNKLNNLNNLNNLFLIQCNLWVDLSKIYWINLCKGHKNKCLKIHNYFIICLVTLLFKNFSKFSVIVKIEEGENIYIYLFL